jgi:hypothetical protein
MKAISTSSELGVRAKEAMKAVLGQVSTIELKGMEMTPDTGREMDLVVRIGVLGRSHTLACKIAPSSEPRAVRKALRELKENAAQISGDTTPVFIAPYLSAEAQALCVESKAGFVDLEDNARLMLGEVFIGKRSLPRREAKALSQAADTIAVRKFGPTRVAAPVLACSVPVTGAA